MLIDFHTHIFPDTLAPRAMESMMASIRAHNTLYHTDFGPHGTGTAADLLSSMAACGCTHSVLCPVVTSSKSTDHTNAFSLSRKGPGLIPFASLLPEEDGWEARLEAIAAQGFPGIKLHPEFQSFYVDSPRCIDLVKRAEALGLIVLFHAGRDLGFGPVYHSDPARFARLLEHVDGRRIITAHMGSWKEWEAVSALLLDSPLYFDTACIPGFLEPEACLALIRQHGAEKILFGSDYPWRTAGETLDYLESLGLTAAEKQLIYSENAAKLLPDGIL